MSGMSAALRTYRQLQSRLAVLRAGSDEEAAGEEDLVEALSVAWYALSPAEKAEVRRAGPQTRLPAAVPFMVTVDMRGRLRRAGFSDAEIDRMTPAEAWAKIGT